MTTLMEDALITMHDDGCVGDEWEITDIEEGPGEVYNTDVYIIKPESAKFSSNRDDVESFTILEGLRIHRMTMYKRKE